LQVAISLPTGLLPGGTQRTALVTMQSCEFEPVVGVGAIGAGGKSEGASVS
jgi:hypothetical protein